MELKIISIPNGESPMKLIKDAVSDIIVFSAKDLLPDDRVGFSFCSKDFKEKLQGWLAYR